MAKQDDKKSRRQKMTPKEAGRLGGQATARTHDSGFYSQIGSQGGKVSPGNFRNDPHRASEAGRKGGQSRGRRTP